MNHSIKHISFLFFLLSFLFILFIGLKIVLKPTDDIYKLIPEESEIVIEINLQNFIKEIVYQKVFNAQNSELIALENSSTENFKDIMNAGIEINSKAMLFCEKWANNYVWYAVIPLQNKSKFESFIQKKTSVDQVHYTKKYALIQLSTSSQQAAVTTHINNILQSKVKSINSSNKITHDFEDENEINAYINISNATHINEGCLSLNFEQKQIKLSGFFHPKASATPLEPIKYKTDKDVALSLITSLNLLNAFNFIFHDSYHEIPEYNQMALNFDGTTLMTTNNTIPIDIYPHVNMELEILNKNNWSTFLNKLNSNENITVGKDSMVLNLQGKLFLQYHLSEKLFNLYQTQQSFIPNETKGHYFSLFAQPGKFIDKTFFKKDEKNPPKIIANMKINVIQTILNDFQYIKNLDTVTFDIFKDAENADFTSEGKIVYKTENSHSIISTMLLYQNFMNTFGIFLE
ncbi:hypothetical protein DNU06_16570 [Putridiphycobacter roseus]|uniref:Uncharacterized protein n=1 Tax=Putridiphycobacter roseus TaxID=2219161 RepID=A0A2W1MX27_9FLAO|nr:hypothetical protein [Putridiphycobacter roseus]PZE15710.1 hypothetical protein DNU06_16570 [Putridiphycobacter roseus]